ncbi:MAG: 16S rRNA (guanine(966)-N(2))-methyltransferase RsmD [Alphaproteobacteria bacterium]|nr:16S rRNA (guanine(966)-N(2))-methyltransferase RsmD [Alphaproteobacteria bacterium]
MTRIVAGRFRARRLEVPKGRDVRPTTDRMRERLFSMLMHSRYPDMEGARVADIFAGTGALGLEALSRGAAHATFIEQARPSLDCIKRNIETLGVQAETTLLPKNATALPDAKEPCDFIFMDPPYRKGLVIPTLERLLEKGWLATDGAIICELGSDEDITAPDGLVVLDDRTQGQQRILILTKNA